MEVDTQRIFKHFEGIDAKRQRALQEIAYVNAKKDQYKPSYIERFKDDKRQELIADRQERASRAREEIENIKDELTEKRFKDPYDEINASVIKTEDKILVELQQNRQMQLLQRKMNIADTAGEFKELLAEHGEYEDFYKAIRLEIKQRAKDMQATDFQALQFELEQEPEEFRELASLESTVTFFGNMDHHPIGLDGGDYTNVDFEPLV